MMEFVSRDDDIPNIWKVIKVMLQTTNQMVNTLPILDTLQKIKFFAG